MIDSRLSARQAFSAVFALVLLASCAPQRGLSADNEALLVNKWVFGHATLTNRAEFVAHTQQQLTAAARRQGASQEQIDALQQAVAQVTEEDVKKQSDGVRMSFRDDHSVSVSVTPSGGKEVHLAGTWVLKDKVLTITTKGEGPGAPDSTQVYSLASVSKSQLVLTGNGVTQTYIAID